jgi:ferritin
MINEKMVKALNEQINKESAGSLLMIDHQLAKREFNPPAK